MSKELDSVELARIEFEKGLEDDTNNEWLKRLIKGLKMAEQSLQRLEAIDNAKPSEALKDLEKIKNYAKSDLDSIPQSFYELCVKKNKEIDNIVETIKQALIKAHEQEKALKIIFKKKVDIIYLEDSNTVDEYNKHFGCAICKLTEEEFELLKRCYHEIL